MHFGSTGCLQVLIIAFTPYIKQIETFLLVGPPGWCSDPNFNLARADHLVSSCPTIYLFRKQLFHFRYICPYTKKPRRLVGPVSQKARPSSMLTNTYISISGASSTTLLFKTTLHATSGTGSLSVSRRVLAAPDGSMIHARIPRAPFQIRDAWLHRIYQNMLFSRKVHPQCLRPTAWST